MNRAITNLGQAITLTKRAAHDIKERRDARKDCLAGDPELTEALDLLAEAQQRLLAAYAIAQANYTLADIIKEG